MYLPSVFSRMMLIGGHDNPAHVSCQAGPHCWAAGNGMGIKFNEFNDLSSTWSIIPLTLHFIVGTMTRG
jgi:hypothetical protein